MTCRDMVQRMLDAELEELSGIGDSTLARHIGECIPCRLAGRRIVSLTRQLGEDLPASPVPGTATARASGARALARFAMGAALAASVTAGIMVRGAGAPAPIHSSGASPRSMEPAVVKAEPAVLPRHRLQSARASRQVASNHVPTAMPPHDDTEPRVIARRVAVQVHAGSQAIVMQTSDPLVTVVWLHSIHR